MTTYTIELDIDETVTQDDDRTLLQAFNNSIDDITTVRLVDDEGTVIDEQRLSAHENDEVGTMEEGEVIEGPSRVAETDEEDEQVEEGEEDEDTQDEEAEKEEAGKSASDEGADVSLRSVRTRVQRR